MSGPRPDGEAVSARARHIAETTERVRLCRDVSEWRIGRAAKLIEESVRRPERSAARSPPRCGSGSP
ncbi:hypothetical protein [Kutzneria sp. CA-103260]|uniref:hypothetical protein n=1 Tax=Kutzneria sp. CA-103260 TaxID=2802641 RepID=UPI001BACB7EE|nr:hypothetical protein [Kutzneria sp. CA-103260]